MWGLRGIRGAYMERQREAEAFIRTLQTHQSLCRLSLDFVTLWLRPQLTLTMFIA